VHLRLKKSPNNEKQINIKQTDTGHTLPAGVTLNFVTVIVIYIALDLLGG